MKRIIFYTFVMLAIVICLYLYCIYPYTIITKEPFIFVTDRYSLRSTGMSVADEWNCKYYAFLGDKNASESKVIAANAAFNLAIKCNPNSAQNYLSRGLLKFERSHYKLAISDLNMAKKYHYGYEGDGEEKLEYFDLAMLHFTKARAEIELIKQVNKYGAISKNTIEMELNMALNYARTLERKDLAASILELKNSFLEDMKQN